MWDWISSESAMTWARACCLLLVRCGDCLVEQLGPRLGSSLGLNLDLDKEKILIIMVKIQPRSIFGTESTTCRAVIDRPSVNKRHILVLAKVVDINLSHKTYYFYTHTHTQNLSEIK